MPLYRAFLQSLGAVVLLASALACGGKKDSPAQAESPTFATISGTVTYQRVPLLKDAQGVPTRLADATVATNLQTLPARGVMVRIFQQMEQTAPDGTKTPIWILAQLVQTDSSGKYSLKVAKDRQTMVELLSSFQGGAGYPVNLVADPAGIDSSTVAPDRLLYALRKAVDGSAPAAVKAPSALLSGDKTVDFAVGLHDAWWLTNPAYTSTPVDTQVQLETDVPGRTTGTGSRVLAIGDTIASFVATYGSATPGVTFDLHYWPGQSESRGSFVEYNLTHYPKAFDGSTGRFRCFGSLQGGPINDDAWDEGVILPLLARNRLIATSAGRTYSVPTNPLNPVGVPLTDLTPELARVEGLAGAMACNLLKSPYLADTQGTGLASVPTHISDISSLGAPQLTPYSALAIQALAWEIILKANSLPSPGTVSNWDTINPLATLRLFQAPAPTNGSADAATARDIEPLNIFSQMNRLKEVKGGTEPVDLAAIFTDAALTPLAAPMGIPWPRPATGLYASFVSEWGTDPNSSVTPLPPLALSMAKATQVNGAYPNLSQGEVQYSGFSLNVEKRYVLSVTISPALNAGVQIELDLPRMSRTFSFTGTGESLAALLIPVHTTAVPFYHPVRLRLKSPTGIQPDVTVTLALTPAL